MTAPTAGGVGPAALRWGPPATEPGLVVVPAGTVLWRGHSPGRGAAYFGPPPGGPATGRYDLHQRDAASPGTCYLALGLEGVLLERVLRGSPVRFLSEQQLRRQHALSQATLARDVALVDLVSAALSTVHRLEAQQITRRPRPRAVPPYPFTSRLAARLVADYRPGGATPRADGICFGSRFGPGAINVALWDVAAGALAWTGPVPLTPADVPGLLTVMGRLGLALLP